MKVEQFIAKRYFFAGKRKNIINIITLISVVGIATGAMALVVVLSVFNGFDYLIKTLYGSFDPDLKIEIVSGKTMNVSDSAYNKILQVDGIEHLISVYEDNVLLKYDDKTHPARLKGVESVWWAANQADTMIVEGSVFQQYDSVNFCVLGRELAWSMGLGLYFIQPVWFYAPRKTENREIRAENAFVSGFLFPTGLLAIQSDIDSKYVIVNLSFARELFQADGLVTAYEIKVKNNVSIKKVQKSLEDVLGSGYTVKNRLQQHEFLYKVMKAEKWIIFAILTFILIIASFSIVGSLMMLIIDKKDDTKTLRTMGANLKTIRRLFLIEGMYITLVGSLSGITIGTFLCFIQERFGLIQINSSGRMLIDAYPVKMAAGDIALIFITVSIIGYLASYYSVRFISGKKFR